MLLNCSQFIHRSIQYTLLCVPKISLLFLVCVMFGSMDMASTGFAWARWSPSTYRHQEDGWAWSKSIFKCLQANIFWGQCRSKCCSTLFKVGSWNKKNQNGTLLMLSELEEKRWYKNLYLWLIVSSYSTSSGSTSY